MSRSVNKRILAAARHEHPRAGHHALAIHVDKGCFERLVLDAIVFDAYKTKSLRLALLKIRGRQDGQAGNVSALYEDAHHDTLEKAVAPGDSEPRPPATRVLAEQECLSTPKHLQIAEPVQVSQDSCLEVSRRGHPGREDNPAEVRVQE